MTDTAFDTVIVLTGASRGLGAALARDLAAPRTKIIALLRKPDPALEADVAAKGGVLQQVAVDLADLDDTAVQADILFPAMPAGAQCYWLINNAGTVAPISTIAGLGDPAALRTAFDINVNAVILLSAAFLRAMTGRQAQGRLLNISSGAGRNAKAGWGVYCATKAALDMFTRTVNTERDTHGVAAVALAPGVVDTDMQGAIRASDPAHFPAVAQFQGMKDKGQLASPANVAASIHAYLQRDDFGQTEIDDIRNY